MNVSTINPSFFLSARKMLVLCSLLIINVAAILVQTHAQVNTFGSMEALGYHWNSYSNLNKNVIKSQVVYGKINDDEMASKSISYEYKYAKSKNSEFIVVGEEGTIPARHNRVFYLDDDCMLFFSGQSGLTLKNASLRCLY